MCPGTMVLRGERSTVLCRALEDSKKGPCVVRNLAVDVGARSETVMCALNLWQMPLSAQA